MVPDVPDEFDLMYGNIRPPDLRQHVERLESDLEDLQKGRVATGGFELGDDDE